MSKYNIKEYPKIEGDYIKLKDDRLLGYKEYNIINLLNNKNITIILIPGLPGTRFFCHPDVIHSKIDNIENKNIIKLYVIERPGIGISTFNNGTFIDFTSDFIEFVKAKKIIKCSIIGYSAGGPFAMAIAHELHNKEIVTIEKLAIISSVCPYSAKNVMKNMNLENKIAWILIKYFPYLIKLIIYYKYNIVIKDCKKYFIDEIKKNKYDFELCLKNENIEKIFIESTLEMYSRKQYKIEFHEYSLWAKDWGFELKNIITRTKVWYGINDNGTTYEMGKYIVSQIPNCEYEFINYKGHLVFFEEWNNIINWILLS